MRSAARLIASSKPAVTFEAHPMRAFAYALEHQLTALVVAIESGERHHVWFEDGLPVVVEVAANVMPLRDALATLPGIDMVAVDMLGAGAATESSLAEQLVAAGVVEPGSVVVAQHAQLNARLDYLLGLGQMQFRVYRAQKSDDGAERIPPLRVFVRGARIRTNRPMVDAYVKRLGDLRLRVVSSVDLEAGELTKPEHDIARKLAETPLTVEQLLNGGADLHDVQAVVFALSMEGQLRRVSFGAPQSDPPVAGSFPPVGPGSQPRPSDPDLRRETPPPISSPTISSIKPDSERAGARVTGTRQRRASKIGMEAFREAERAVGMSNFGAASLQVKKALTFDPENQSYRALSAYADAAKQGYPKDLADQALAALELIVEQHADNAAAHYYRARLLKSLRRNTEAREAFARAAQLDPNNMHAVSEAKKKHDRRTDPRDRQAKGDRNTNPPGGRVTNPPGGRVTNPPGGRVTGPTGGKNSSPPKKDR